MSKKITKKERKAIRQQELAQKSNGNTSKINDSGIRKFADEHKKKQKQNPNTLYNFYWGYNGDDKLNGFELTPNCFTQALGMSYKEAINFGKKIFDLVDLEVEIYKQGKVQEFYGISDEQYIREETQKLHAGIAEFNRMKTGEFDLHRFTTIMMLVPMSISVLVCAGVINQSEYNGDKFDWVQTSDDMLSGLYDICEERFAEVTA